MSWKNMDQDINQDGTVGKALALLDVVAEFANPVRFNDILAKSPYPKATSYRFLQTLTRQGMLSYDEGHHTYELGIRLVRLAHSAWQQSSLAPIARPYIDALSAKINQTIHLAQLDGGQVLYVDKRNAINPIPMFSDAGKIGPAYCTGVGKAMLAFLPEALRETYIAQQSFHPFTEHTITNADDLRTTLFIIRNEAVAFDRQEHEPNIICIAVPILSSHGKVLGGMSVTTSTERMSLQDLLAYKPSLQFTAKQIGEATQPWRFPDAEN